MPNHIENSKRVIQYVKYLRDVSRKIVTRNGFDVNRQHKVDKI